MPSLLFIHSTLLHRHQHRDNQYIHIISSYRSTEYYPQPHYSSHSTPKWQPFLKKNPSSTPHASHSSSFSSYSTPSFIPIAMPSNHHYPQCNPYWESITNPTTAAPPSFSPNYSQTGPPPSSTSLPKSTLPSRWESSFGNTPTMSFPSLKPSDSIPSLHK